MSAGAALDQCGELPGFVDSPTCSALFSGATIAAIPNDEFNDVEAKITGYKTRASIIGDLNFTVGCTDCSPAVTITDVGHFPSTECFNDCNSVANETDMGQVVNFHTNGPATVGIWFGAHLALGGGEDVIGDPKWVAGAASVPGGPFAIHIESVDGSSVGQRTNNVQPVLAPPTPGAEPLADLSITKTASKECVNGVDQVTYFINVRNNGPDSAVNVVLTEHLDHLPAGWSFAIPFGCSSSPEGFTCDLGDLANGASDLIAFVVNTTATGTFVNTATAVSEGGTFDTNTGNNTATLTTSQCTNVPTLNEWGMILFMMLAGIGSVYYLRRYKKI
jgi:uncharacterized repeat protein (TIGR01451 family)